MSDEELTGADEALAALESAVAGLRRDSRDRRLTALAEAVSTARAAVARERAAAPRPEVPAADRRGKLEGVLDVLLGGEPPSLPAAGERLLDALLAATGARRGFLLFARPDGKAAEVVAVRHYPGTDLSLREFEPSRSILREAFESPSPIRLDDAATHAAFGDETSVRTRSLRSVLAVPLRDAGRAVGVVYLENEALAGAFREEDERIVAVSARVLLELLRAARLLPWDFGAASQPLVALGEPGEILGRHPSIAALRSLLARLAPARATVLIEGETGTGKELVAHALHALSPRRDRPFVAVNCAAIPESLLESELFGHEKGAFTGAAERQVGRLERAEGGTVFLDEVSELPFALQAKLLRFLQGGEMDRLGGRETIRVDVRVVAATSKPLRALVDAGRFQDALFYRLNVVPVSVPPLRERGEDVRLLAATFFARFGELYGRALRVDEPVYDLLRTLPFPGNVRELENLVHRIVALGSGNVVSTADLPPELVHRPRVSLEKGFDGPSPDLPALRRKRERLLAALAAEETSLAAEAVREAGGNVTAAAARLGVHRATLHELLRRGRGRRPSP